MAVVSMTTASVKPNRAVPPVPGPTPPLRLPVVGRGRLSNGLDLLFVEHHKVPVVNFTLVLPHGSATDPAGAAGLASLTAQMLDEGTQKRSSLELSDELDFLGAHVGSGTG